MIASLLILLNDGLVLLGVLIIAIAAYGMVRLPDFQTSLHAASKAAFLGLVPILLAIVLTGELVMVARAILIIIFLLLTTPVATHAISRAAYHDARQSDQSASPTHWADRRDRASTER